AVAHACRIGFQPVRTGWKPILRACGFEGRMKRFLIVCLTVTMAVLGACTRRTADGGFRLIFIPKLISIPYFLACKRGAEEAAKELHIEMEYKGPTKADAN